MKPKVYKLAGAALLCLAALGTPAFAQQNSAPAPAQAPTPATPATPAPMVDLPPLAPLGSMVGPQDSTYTKKMRELQAQMRELQNKMRDLSREQGQKTRDDNAKRSAERAKEMADRMAERSKQMAERNKEWVEQFNRSFTDKFKDFGQKFKFNFDKSDSNLDQKVASGDVKLKTKTYSKSYSVDGNDKLQLDNRFGKITVNTWAKNEFKVDVEIKAYADDDSKAQDLLDRISISDSKGSNSVSFTTNIKEDDNKNNFWGTWTNNGKSSVRKAIINYTVYMPAKSALNINNKYGGVELPDLFGQLSISNTYGSLSAKNLGNTNNSISVKYGSAGISNLGGGDLNVAYGSLNLESAGKLDAKLSYGSGKIGKLVSSGTINVRYGGLEVGTVDPSVKNLAVSSDYSPVKLGSVGNTDFDVTVHYGGFSHSDAVNVTSKSPSDSDRGWSSTTNYKGHVGKGSSERSIVINANYAGVKIEP